LQTHLQNVQDINAAHQQVLQNMGAAHQQALHDMGAAHQQSLQEMISLLVRELGEENRKTLNSTVTMILDNQKVLLVQAEDRLEEKFERWYQRFQGQARDSNQ